MEFALVLPILLLLVFGIVEFGFIFNRWVTVTHSAREGVRVYSLTGSLDQAIDAAHASAPDLVAGTTIECFEPEVPEELDDGSVELSMRCQTNYNFALFVVTGPIEFGSTAKMRRE